MMVIDNSLMTRGTSLSIGSSQLFEYSPCHGKAFAAELREVQGLE